jgi:hypothetical protein
MGRNKHHFNTAAQHTGHDFRSTLVRYVLHADASLFTEYFGCKVQTVPDTGRTVDRAVLFCVGNELLQGFVG